MFVNKFIAFMLVLIFIALAWRFLLPLFVILLSLLMWYLLFLFVKGIVAGIKEMMTTNNRGSII